MDTVDTSIGTFVAKMKALDLHDRVVLTTASKFGRTYRFNGRGNHLLVGGPVRGAHIRGANPTDLLMADDRNIGQGRFAPSLPWEGAWHAVAHWMGVGSGAAMGHVLPNLGAFPPRMLLNASAVFWYPVPQRMGQPGAWREPEPRSPSPGPAWSSHPDHCAFFFTWAT